MRAAATLLLACVVVGAGTAAFPPPTTSARSNVSWVLIGDSVTAGNVNLITPQLAAAQLPPWYIEALSGRMIDKRVPGPRATVSSGLDAVARVKALGHTPALWVIELGTNDSSSVERCGCADMVAFAGEKIDRLLAAIGPGQRVVWLTVRNAVHATGTAALNEAMRRRGSTTFGVADWETYSAGHPDWFLDAVHPSVTGAIEYGRFVAATVKNPPFRRWPDCADLAAATSTPGSFLGTLIAAAEGLRAASRCTSGPGTTAATDVRPRDVRQKVAHLQGR